MCSLRHVLRRRRCPQGPPGGEGTFPGDKVDFTLYVGEWYLWEPGDPNTAPRRLVTEIHEYEEGEPVIVTIDEAGNPLPDDLSRWLKSVGPYPLPEKMTHG